ncbi:hypothetical protein DFJ74DRAFT_606663 [Hyaloraphidium curvatum]|nr:hypothetical protein DFJ74DRAFT_606663 [Hyaloraphidium curvatum]
MSALTAPAAHSVASVCVFCGSSLGNDPAFAQAADDLGRLLAENGVRLVYGGGKVGLMGRVADAALKAGGQVVGVLPKFMRIKEIDHPDLTECIYVDTMHERKTKMAELADAFVALPGGIGTFEELFEMTTWTQLKLHTKPVLLLSTKGYYAPLVSLLDAAVSSGFVREDLRRAAMLSASEPAEVLPMLRAWDPSGLGEGALAKHKEGLEKS